MTLAELKQKRARIAAEMRTFHEAQGENAWGGEQRSKWDGMKTDLKKLDEQIQREEELRDTEQRYVDDNAGQLAAPRRRPPDRALPRSNAPGLHRSCGRVRPI